MANIKYQLPNFFKHKCAVWEFTLKCNSNCIHCGSSAGKSRLDELNTPEALNLVKDLKSCGYNGIALMGGEPFLRNDWYDVAKAIKRNRMKLTIVSNGLQIKDKISKLKQLNVDCVSLSLDGASPQIHDYIRGVKGAFKKVLNSIRLLQKESIPISLITTVSKINLKELSRIRDLLLNRNIAWQIQMAIPIGRFPRELVISREQYYGVSMFIALNLEKYTIKQLPLMGAHCFGYFSKTLPETGLEPWFGCQAGKSVLGIQSNGNVKGCLTLSDDFIEGNIRNTNLSDILKSRLRCSDYLNNLPLEDYCNSCEVFKKCKGGCLGMKLAINSTDYPYCLRTIEKRLFKDNPLPFRWEMNSIISKYKNLYQKIILNKI
jgi:radical SAM protein with 4Fe4S-binding SPASM domain